MSQKAAFLSVRLEARGAAAPRERATGGPHLPSRRLHLRVRLLARLLEAPRRTAGPLPKADQELSRRLIHPAMAEWSLQADDLYASVMLVDLASPLYRLALSSNFEHYTPVSDLAQLASLRGLLGD